MKLKTSQPKLFIAIAGILAVIVTFYSACQKQIKPELKGTNSLIENARNWFTNEIVEREKQMIAQPFSVLPSNSPARRFARMRGLSTLLNWDNAREYNQGEFHYVITPIDQSIKPLDNKNFEAARSLVFYKDQSGTMHMNVIEILSKKGTTLGAKTQAIASIAFENKHLNKNNSVHNVNATIVFYNENYDSESNFQITNGSWGQANTNL